MGSQASNCWNILCCRKQPNNQGIQGQRQESNDVAIEMETKDGGLKPDPAKPKYFQNCIGDGPDSIKKCDKCDTYLCAHCTQTDLENPICMTCQDSAEGERLKFCVQKHLGLESVCKDCKKIVCTNCRKHGKTGGFVCLSCAQVLTGDCANRDGGPPVEPTQKFYYHIGNANYGPGKDLTEGVERDQDTLRQCFEQTLLVKDGEKNAEVRFKTNFMYEDFDKLFRHFEEKTKSGETSLVWLYYSGHGNVHLDSELTVAQCTDHETDDDEYYPLETKLRLLAQRDNVSVVAIFDCCRPVWKSMERDYVPKDTKNYTMTYACPDDLLINNQSTLAEDIWEVYQKSEKQGRIKTPSKLLKNLTFIDLETGKKERRGTATIGKKVVIGGQNADVRLTKQGKIAQSQEPAQTDIAKQNTGR